LSFTKQTIDRSCKYVLDKILNAHDIDYKEHILGKYKSWVDELEIKLIITKHIVYVEKCIIVDECDANDTITYEIFDRDFVERIIKKKGRFIVTIMTRYNDMGEIVKIEKVDIAKYLR